MSTSLPREQRAKGDAQAETEPGRGPAGQQGAQAPRATINTGLPPHAPGEGSGRETTRLELPHERDQNLQATREQPDAVMKQAASDLQSGQVDTDMRSTPGLDAERREQLTGRQSASPRKPDPKR